MSFSRMVRAAAAAFVIVALAEPLAKASIEDGWLPAEITAGRQPVRYVVTKAGWREGPQALVEDDPRKVEDLYARLAGNSRMGHTCGCHWAIHFEYRDAPAESIAINERCETFRREPAETWQAVKAAFTRARTEPTHFFVVLSARDPHAGAHLRKLLEPRFGTVIDSPAQ